MSGGLYGALSAAVAGINAQSNKIGVISDNIANVNTVGFKQSRATFSSLVTSAVGASFSPGGVLSRTQQLADQQGNPISTGSATDLSIQGAGFFVGNSRTDGTGQTAYTRAGSFSEDNAGYLVNTGGLYLFAWPLDANGLIPGAPGNTTNTTSSANLSSLVAVNVRNLTSTASATTNVRLAANLDARLSAYPGAGVTAALDSNDTDNVGIRVSDILVPSSVDSLTRGDKFTITTGSGIGNSTFTYGGFTKGRDILATSGTSTDDGDNALDPFAASVALAAHKFIMVDNSASMIIDQAAPAGVHVGDTITFTGNTATPNGLTAANINKKLIVTSIDTVNNQFTVKLPQAAMHADLGNDPIAADTTRNGGGDTVITVTQVGHGLSDGDTVVISGAAVFNGITANGTHTGINVIDADHYEITLTGQTAGATVSGGGAAVDAMATLSGAGVITYTAEQFAGNILDATDTDELFLQATSVSNFLTTALSFTISSTAIPAGSATFTYTAGTANKNSGTFNTLKNLVDAINSVSGLTARIQNGRLYVGAVDADNNIQFTNGAQVGTSVGSTVNEGIDWARALGVSNVAAAGGSEPNRYSSLQGLANKVNAVSGGTALKANLASTGASLRIISSNPLDTIRFDDDTYGGGGNNTGSPLAALGITGISSWASVVPSGTPVNTGALGPAYDPTDPSKNMAGGRITPQYSRTVTIFDSQGIPHDLEMMAIKVGLNTWSMEVTVPTSHILAGSALSTGTGLIAYGNVTFNGDTSLATIDTLLSAATNIDWNPNVTGASRSTISFNLGTAGAPLGTPNALAIGKTDGLSQSGAANNTIAAVANGASVGNLKGVSVRGDGTIVASFSNGTSQDIFRVPLAGFAAPNQLQPLSGNGFIQSATSGPVNLNTAGTNGMGDVLPSSLEQSNVELAEQLTDMIIAQRAYEANTKTIQTTDNLLQVVSQIIR